MDVVTVYYTQLKTTYTNDLFTTYLGSLPLFLQDKITRLKSKQAQYSKLFGLLLLQRALEHGKYSPSLISQLKYNEHGKPFISNAFYFNISHSANMVVCAFSKTPIGIDIEKIRKVNLNSFTPYFTEHEFEILRKEDNTYALFFELWTQKEAFVKAIGMGMNFPFKDIAFHNHEIYFKGDSWYTHTLTIEPHFVTHICTNIAKPTVELVEIY